MEFGFLGHLQPGQVSGAVLGAGNRLVSWARRDDTLVFLLGRLFYRKDLLARLPRKVADPDQTDAELVLSAFRHGGEQALGWLEGEYSLVVWDARCQSLWAQRRPLRRLAAVLACVRLDRGDQQ